MYILAHQEKHQHKNTGENMANVELLATLVANRTYLENRIENQDLIDGLARMEDNLLSFNPNNIDHQIAVAKTMNRVRQDLVISMQQIDVEVEC